MDHKNLKAVDVLGVKIHDVSLKESVEVVENWLKGKDKHYIVTPNPEFVMAAQKDKAFMDVLNHADLAIPDGRGLKLSDDIVNTTPGIDLMEMLIRQSSEKGFTIGLLGGKNGVAKETAECLQKRYPKLKITFFGSGGEVDSHGCIAGEDLRIKIYDLGEKNLKSLIINHKSLPQVDLLFVAFGQVKQEKWIAKNLPHLPVKVTMGVGGAFDYLSGQVPRAPKWIQNLGLEWLFRLIIQPWRIKRQLVLLKFAWLVIKGRLTKSG